MSLTKESVICALLLALCCGNLSAKEPTGFIFTGNKVINASNEKEFVLLNEKLPVAELKKRFSGYKIVATAGEDCSICASISGRNGSFEIDYDEDGLVITGIFSSDKRSYDALGNAVGSSLRNAIGTQTARCDAGMRTLCASKRLDNLSYIVDEVEGCPAICRGQCGN